MEEQLENNKVESSIIKPKRSQNKTINVLDSRGSNWIRYSQIEHIFRKSTQLNLLNYLNSWTIRESFKCFINLVTWRKVKNPETIKENHKTLLPNKLSIYSELELRTATFQIVIELYKIGLVSNLVKGIPGLIFLRKPLKFLKRNKTHTFW